MPSFRSFPIFPHIYLHWFLDLPDCLNLPRPSGIQLWSIYCAFDGAASYDTAYNNCLLASWISFVGYKFFVSELSVSQDTDVQYLLLYHGCSESFLSMGEEKLDQPTNQPTHPRRPPKIFTYREGSQAPPKVGHLNLQGEYPWKGFPRFPRLQLLIPILATGVKFS